MSLALSLVNKRLPLLARKSFQVTQVACSSGELSEVEYYRMIAYDREVVGFGMNGNPHYTDNLILPFPSIRFMRTTEESKALQEKANGDWKNLSIEEKKQLYRHSFRQTLCESHADLGENRYVIGGIIWCFAITLFFTYILRRYILDPLPESMSSERRSHQMRRYLDLKYNPLMGPTVKYDYEKDDWKK